MDYLTRAYKENDQIYLQGEQMAARAFVAAQARANGMVDGDEYLKVPFVSGPPIPLTLLPERRGVLFTRPHSFCGLLAP